MVETDRLTFINSERSLEVLVQTDRKMEDQIRIRTETNTKQIKTLKGLIKYQH